MTSLLAYAGGFRRSTYWWAPSHMYHLSHTHLHTTHSIAGLDLICNLWFVEEDIKMFIFIAGLVLFFSFPLCFSFPQVFCLFANTPSLRCGERRDSSGET